MTKRQLKENYARAVIFDEEGERKKACEARRKELYDGLDPADAQGRLFRGHAHCR